MKGHASAAIALSLGFSMAMVVFAPVIATLLYFAAPELQGRFDPVVDFSLLRSGRVDDVGFWETSFHKRYDAKLEAVDFYVRTAQNQHIPVRAYRCHPDNSEVVPAAPSTHHAGESWVSRYCIKILPDLESTAGVQIEGYSTFSTWPYWYVTHQKILSLTLPGGDL